MRKKNENEAQERRLRLPREGEILGIVEQMLGASRMRVKCFDGNERIIRIPGKFKKRVWIREGDYVLIKPWVVQSDAKGDVVYRYTAADVERLRREGIIKEQ